MECLDDNVLTAYLEHLLAPEARRAVEAHLDTCEECLAITCEVVRSGQPGSAIATAVAETIGRYEIRDLIGRGGMGAVYVAYDPQLERRIALKIVRTSAFEDPKIRARLSHESRAMAKIRHTNVVSVYDAGELDDGVFIAMELIDGVTLSRWQASSERAWAAIATMYLAVGRGLVAAHAAGVVHRDFKPDNVLVDRDGRPAVTDFGLAVGLADPAGDAVVGTPRFMSPEQFASEAIDARSDQFSFAVALYEALYRQAPFAGTTASELATSVRAGAITARPADTAVPLALHRVLERALRVPRSERYPDMHAMLHDVAAAMPRRSRWPWFAGGAAVVAAAATVALVLRGGGEAAPTTAKRTTLLIPRFANTTGDPRLDDVLDVVAADVIYRSTTLEPLAGLELVRAAKATGGTDPDAIAAKLPGRTTIVVRGTVGPGFDVALDGQTRHAGSTEELVVAVADLARDLRRRRGDDSVAEDPPPSSSIDALHDYAQATLQVASGDFKGAADRLRHALSLDPHFVTARVSLGLVLYNLSDQKGAIAAMEAAIEEADRLPERLRLQLLGDYYGTIGKYPEAISAYQRYLARWPGDARTEINLIATAIDANDFALAYELAKHTVEEHPETDVVRANFVLAELATGRLKEATTDGLRMLDELPRPSDFSFAFVAMAQVLLGDRAGATRTWGRLARYSPELAAQGMADQAIYEGRLDDAFALVDPWAQLGIIMNSPRDTRAELLMRSRIRLARGDRAGAAADATLVMDSGEPRPDYIAASLAVAAGDLDGADARAHAWQNLDGLEARMYGKLLEGDLALARGTPAAAVTAYREATRMAPLWIARARLARGYVAADQRTEAQREIAWCLEHRGEGAVFLTPTVSLLVELEAAHKAILVK